jgi:SAM-dependent methyltransferase
LGEQADLYSIYSRFSDPAVAAVRRETYGEDIGQNGWITADEFDGFVDRLNLTADSRVIEVASGSGGPALRLAARVGCRLTGIDENEAAVATATGAAAAAGLDDRASFAVADANAILGFADSSFDAVLCLDAFNHLTERRLVLSEWHRVLRPGGSALFTDPVVVTGPVTDEELRTRSSIGRFLFTPAGVNEALMREVGFDAIEVEDGTENMAGVSGRWADARERHREALTSIEGEQGFASLQAFLRMVQRVSSERRLSRLVYLARRPLA